MKKLSQFFCVLLFLFSDLISTAQSVGGNDFWFTFPLNFANAQTGSPGQNQIVIVSGCEVSGEYSFPALGGAPVSFTVSPGSATTINLAANNNTASEVVANNGIHITTDNIVSAYAVDYLPYTVDGETMLPTSQLGMNHVVMGYSSSNSSNLPTQFTVCATQDNTKVTITASGATSANLVTQSHPAGATWSVTLNQGQTYMVSAAGGNSVNGSRVVSDKPVTVISHTACTNFQYSACDMLMAQMIPTSLWGTKYVTVQAQARTGANCGDWIQVTAGSLPVSYTHNGTAYTLPAYGTRLAGTGANANAVIISNNPIQVSQFSQGTSCDGAGDTDPEHIIVYPESMWINDYTFSCSTLLTTLSAGITIVVDAITTGFEIDGIAIPSAGWLNLGTSTYKYKRVSVAPGPHHLTNINGTKFAFYQYAVGDAESYIVQGGAPFTNCQIAGCQAGFTYPGSPFCQNAANPSPALIGAAVTGVFTALPAGLVFVSTSTGEINLAASTPGTYSVTNTVTTDGGCTYSTNVTITAPKVASFSYPTPLCKNGVNPSPTFIGGGVAGVFTSTAGLSINANTGQINLSASTPGNYVVTNTVAANGGCPAASATAPITITALPIATFNYPNTPYCASTSNPLPVYSAGATAGTFTATPTGLSIGSADGLVVLGSSAAGTYTVTNTIAAAGGCPAVSATSPITVTIPRKANFSYTNPHCPDGIDPLPTLDAGSTAGTYSSAYGLALVNATSGKINLDSSFTGTDSIVNMLPAMGGCPIITAKAAIIINRIQDPDFAYSSSTFCQTGGNQAPIIGGDLGGVFSATPAGLTFVNTSTGEIDVANTSLNTYTITYTTPGPCSRIGTVNITITNAPSATFTFTGTPYCQDVANPTPTFTGSGTAGVFTASPTGVIFVNQNTGEIDLAASTAGLYNVTNTIAASGGCVAATSSAPLKINPVQSSLFNYSSSTFCSTGSNPIPTITGVSGGTFTTTPVGLVFINNTSGEIDLAGSALNTYTITYTTPGPCATSSSLTLTITSIPTGKFSFQGSPFCQNAGNQSITLNAGSIAGTFSSPAGVAVDPVSGIVNLTASPSGANWVYNTVPAAGGCPVIIDSALITITPLPVASFYYVNTPFCTTTNPNPLPTFTSGGVAGLFSGPAGLTIDPNTGELNLLQSVPTTSTVINTILANGGCPTVIDSSSITITSPQIAGFSYGGPFCEDDNDPSATLVPGAIRGTFTSTQGLVFTDTIGSVDLDGSNTGNYTVTNTIDPTGGCPAITAIATIQINPIQDPSFAYSPATFCKSAGSSQPPVISGNQGGTFTAFPTGLVFVNPVTGQIDLNLSAVGSYNITYTTPGPCARSFTFPTPIVINKAAIASFHYPGTPFCKTANDTVPTFIGGGTPGSFNAEPAGLSINLFTGEIEFSTSDAGTYTVYNRISGSGGCPSVKDSVIVTVTAPPLANFSYPLTPYCQNEVDPTAVLANGATAGNFSSTSGLVIDNNGLVNLKSSNPSTYTVTNYIAAGGGCPSVSANSNITITALPIPDFTYPNSPYCPNENNEKAQLVSPGTAGTFTTSSGNLALNSVDGLITIAGSVPGNYTVTHTIAANGGCPQVAHQTAVTIYPSLNTIPPIDASKCYGETFGFAVSTTSGTGSYTHTWRDGQNNPMGSGSTFTGTASTTETYSVVTTDACSAITNQVTITVSQPVNVEIGAIDTAGCDPFNAAFVNNSNGAYDKAQWLINGIPISTDMNQLNYNFTSPGTYQLVLQLANTTLSCNYVSVPKTILVYANAVANFSYFPTVVTTMEPSVTLLNESRNDDFPAVWTLNDGLIQPSSDHRLHLPEDIAATYKLCLFALDSNACNDTTCQFITVKEDMTIFVPTSFTPNGDGVNDEFKAEGIDFEPTAFSLMVYNRWGQLVFSSSDITDGWDGKYLGVYANNGIYAWKLKARTKNSAKKIEKYGRVTLNR